jgi:hypothetical protein
MLRSKLLILVAVLLSVVLVAGVLIINKLEADRINCERQTISESLPAVQGERYRRKAVTALLAESLAAGRLAVAISTIEELRPQMLAVEEEANLVIEGPSSEAEDRIRADFIASIPYSPVSGEANPEGENTEAAVKIEENGNSGPTSKALVEFFAETFAERLESAFGPYIFDEMGRSSFVHSEAGRFTKCLTVSTSQCMWDYSYMTLMTELKRLAISYRIPLRQRVIVVDKRGTGIADSMNDKWSNEKDFAAANPLIEQVLKTGEARSDTVRLGDSVNLATVVPVISNAEIVGVIAVLDPINSWMARDAGNFAAGASVIYASGRELIDTSMDPQTAASILAADGTGDNRFITAVFPFSGVNLTADLKMVLVRDLASIKAPFERARKIFLSVILVVMLSGLLLSALFMAGFFREIEMLQKGVQEITNGNVSHKFPTDQKEVLVKGLAQSLNFMTSIYQGKDLRDDMLSDADESQSGRSHWDGWQVDEVDPSTKKDTDFEPETDKG